MINKFKYLLFLIVIFCITPSLLIANDVFEFNVTNIEIEENGNIFKSYLQRRQQRLCDLRDSRNRHRGGKGIVG